MAREPRRVRPVPDDVIDAIAETIGDGAAEDLRAAVGMEAAAAVMAGLSPEVWCSGIVIARCPAVAIATAKASALPPEELAAQVWSSFGIEGLVAPVGVRHAMVPREAAALMAGMGLAVDIGRVGRVWTSAAPLPLHWSEVELHPAMAAIAAPAATMAWDAIPHPDAGLPVFPAATRFPERNDPLGLWGWIFARDADPALAFIEGMIAVACGGSIDGWNGDLSDDPEGRPCPLMPTRDGVVIGRGWSGHLLDRIGSPASSYVAFDTDAIESRVIAMLGRGHTVYGATSGRRIHGADLAEALAARAGGLLSP